MKDDLSRIERIYGCVAEYNRIMEEESWDRYEPTEEEIAESEREMEEYYRKIQILSGTPSDLAKELKQHWESGAPKEVDFKSQAEYFYALRDYASDMTKAVMCEICKHYNLTYDSEWATFYRPQEESFAISVEYSDFCEIKSLFVGSLDYETFKDVFRDLYYCGLRPTMNYRKSGNSRILSNCSLGYLRISDLCMLGVESDESLEAEIRKAA